MTKITDSALFIDGPMTYSNNYLVEFTKTRVLKYNKNWMAICCGQTGSGKTYSMMRYGELLDPNFTINNIVFKVSEFMNLLNSGTLKRGAVILFDEAGTGIPKKEWYSMANKMFNYVLQTFRHLNLIVIFTTPSLDFIDSDSRKLFHCYFETKGIDKYKRICYTKPFLIQPNAKTGKIYYKYLRIFVDSRVNIMDTAGFKPPSKHLRLQYELKKKIFTEELNITFLVCLFIF